MTSKGQVEKSGSIVCVAQRPWILNGTIKDNIVFGNSWNQELYQQTIKGCALEADFEALPRKDLTQVGEEGVKLSGGQKARISLARAVYAQADIYLVDDVLAAVDQNTARHLVDQVLGHNGMLHDRTRLLISNHPKSIQESDQIALLDEGQIVETAETTSISSGSKIKQFLAHCQQVSQENETSIQENNEGASADYNSEGRKGDEGRIEKYNDEYATAELGTLAGLKRYFKYLSYSAVIAFAIMMALSFTGYFLTPLWL